MHPVLACNVASASGFRSVFPSLLLLLGIFNVYEMDRDYFRSNGFKIFE